MTSVQNHQQQLSGNKTFVSKRNLFFALLLALGVSSCTPKVGVLRSPDPNLSAATTSPSKENTGNTHVEKVVKKNKFELRNIAFKLLSVVIIGRRLPNSGYILKSNLSQSG